MAAGAHGRYEGTLNATSSGAAPAGQGATATLGGGGATYLKFAVDTAPPNCMTPQVYTPWWSAPQPANVMFPQPGWHFSTAAHGTWTYIPLAGGPFPDAAEMPPGWSPHREMQVLLGCCADFVVHHEAGWLYLPTAGPLGVITFNPPGGKLPAWALAMADGRPYNMPDPGTPGGIPTAGAAPAPASTPASAPVPVRLAADRAPSGISPAWLLVIAAGCLLLLLRRRAS